MVVVKIFLALLYPKMNFARRYPDPQTPISYVPSHPSRSGFPETKWDYRGILMQMKIRQPLRDERKKR